MENEATERVWKVLVVDDEEGFRNVMRITLESCGIAVCVASCADEAREEMKTCSVGMILMDVVMPGMGGLSLAQDLRLADPYLPIVFLTGDTGHVAHLSEDEWLEKTDENFTRKLLAKVREEMGRYIARHEARTTARAVRLMIPRVIALEQSRTLDGEVIRAHGEQLKGYRTMTGKAMLARQIIAGILAFVGPIIGGVWWLTKDIAKGGLEEVSQIKPMRIEQQRLVKSVDALVSEKEIDRRERFEARLEQRAITTKLEAVQAAQGRMLDRLPTNPAPAH